MATKQEALEALIEALHNGKNSNVRMGAAAGLGHVGGEAARRELIKALKEGKTSEIQGAAAEALGRAIAI